MMLEKINLVTKIRIRVKMMLWVDKPQTRSLFQMIIMFFSCKRMNRVDADQQKTLFYNLQIDVQLH